MIFESQPRGRSTRPATSPGPADRAAGSRGEDMAGRPGAALPFFRGEHDFAQLAERARALGACGAKVSVWCVNCATGEDAYSVAMTLREAQCRGEVLATDADGEALAAGRRGIYGLAAVERLGEARRQQHFFMRGSDAASRVALVRGEVRAMVRFARHDLHLPQWRMDGHFDFIFCRDAIVTIDPLARRQVLDRLVAALVPGGVLFLGQADASGPGHPELVPCGRTAFERRPDAD